MSTIPELSNIEHGPKTLEKAIDKLSLTDSRILAYSKFHMNAANPELNISEIQSELIYLTGRFCERYASDLICTLKELEPFCMPTQIKENNRWIIGVGIRDHGVDHNSFIICRLHQDNPAYQQFISVPRTYRKLLAIDIRDTIVDTHSAIRSFTLYDLTNDVTQLEETDLDTYLK